MRISDNPDDVLLIENYVRSEDGEVLARYRICKDEKSNKYGIYVRQLQCINKPRSKQL